MLISLMKYRVYSYIPTPNTLFKNVMKLSATHILIYEDGQISTKRYRELPFTPTFQDDEATVIEYMFELLKDAVQVRLMSEVPFGVFMSDGIDSSIVVGLMSSMISQPVKMFSIGFEEDDFNEFPYASQIAKHFGTDHHEFFIRPVLGSVLLKLAWAYDKPFADLSMLPTYSVSKLARVHVTAVLKGDGGGEIFADYEQYQFEYRINRIPLQVRFLLGSPAMLMSDGMRGKKRLRNMSRDLASRYIRTSTPFPEDSLLFMYRSEQFEHVRDHTPYQRLLSKFRVVSDLNITAQMQYVDVQAYLTDDILVKVDKVSMINLLETRVPLLDQYLVKYASSLPPTLRIRNGRMKYLLKKAAAELLPAKFLVRPKLGFEVPLKHWFRDDLTGYAFDLLEAPRTRQRGIFNPHYIQNLLK